MSKRYFLGFGFLKYSEAALEGIKLDNLSYPYMEKLHELTRETTFISILNGDKVICADIYGQRNLNIAVSRGEIFPFHSTASGKVILAFLPEKDRNKIFECSDFTQYTENTIKKKEDLQSEIKEIEKRGYSLNIGEYNKGINAMAVPIFSHPDRVIASLAVVGIADGLPEKKMKEYSIFFLEAAREISRLLHGEFVPDKYKNEHRDFY